MKNSILPLFLLLSLLSCSKENPSTPGTDPGTDTVPVRNIPAGTLPDPGWTVAPGYDYSSSMTAVVAVDLLASYPVLTPADWQVDTADRLGAFAGDLCIGVTAPSDSLFFLYIVAPQQGDSKTGSDIKLVYYSAQLHNLFLGDTLLRFENGARLGSVAEPLKPLFTNE